MSLACKDPSSLSLVRHSCTLQCLTETSHIFWLQHVLFVGSEADYGKYLGPGSRCLMQSPGFARNGFSSDSRHPTAGCYHAVCKGDEHNRQLYIRFEGPDVDVPCPSGEYLRLDGIDGMEQALTSSTMP